MAEIYIKQINGGFVAHAENGYFEVVLDSAAPMIDSPALAVCDALACVDSDLPFEYED